MITGEYLKKLREAAGMKAQAVAERVGLTKQQYSNIERGVRSFDVNEYVAIMQAMNYSPGDHLPNSLGSDVAAYLPVLNELRRFNADELPAVLEMARAMLAMLERRVGGSPHRQPPTRTSPDLGERSGLMPAESRRRESDSEAPGETDETPGAVPVASM